MELSVSANVFGESWCRSLKTSNSFVERLLS